MNRLDSNILIYAVNSGCQEHTSARQVYEKMLNSADRWIISDRVLFELYRGLRNRKVLERPLNHGQALEQIQFLREDSGVQHCAYETTFWRAVTRGFTELERNSAHLFDRVLAVTLRRHGVETFFTRNEKDFAGFGFKTVINPIDI